MDRTDESFRALQLHNVSTGGYEGNALNVYYEAARKTFLLNDNELIPRHLDWKALLHIADLVDSEYNANQRK